MAGELFGREADLATATAALAGGARMVTLAGPGGIGKTRLLQEMQRTRGGPMVALAPYLDAEGAIAAFLRACGVADGEAALERLVRSLEAAEVRMLYVDNVEHMLPQARGIIEVLLERVASLQVVASSRVALGLEGETLLRLDGLSPSAAAALFLARMPVDTSVERAWVEQFVEEVEGLPLAIEIAAPWLAFLSPEQLRQRFSPQLVRRDGAGLDAGARHASLETVVTSSWTLLTSDAQTVARALAHLPGGADAALLEIATSLSLEQVLIALDTLVRHSLARKSGRAVRLFRAVREFVARLPESTAALAGVEQAVIQLDSNRENLVAIALRASPNVVQAALKLHPFLLAKGPYGEHLAILEKAESVCSDPMQLAAIRLARGEALRLRGRLDALGAVLETVQGLGAPSECARLAMLRGWHAKMRSDLVSACRFYQEAEALTKSHDPRLFARVLGEIAVLRHSEGDPEGAQTLHVRALELHRAHQDVEQQAVELSYLAVATHRLGKMQDSLALHEQARAEHLAAGNARYAAAEDMHRGYVLFELGRLKEAHDAYVQAEAALRRVGEWVLEGLTCVGLALVENALALAPDAALARAENLLARVDSARFASVLMTARGHVALERGELESAGRCYAAALAGSEALVVGTEPLTEAYLAWCLQADPERARTHAENACAKLTKSQNRAPRECANAIRERLMGSSVHVATLARLASSDARRVLKLLDSPGARVRLGADARNVTVNGRIIDLKRRAAVRHILLALVESHEQAPGVALSLAQIIQAGWPEERMSETAAQKRAYTAIWTLRNEVLGSLLVTRDDGYVLEGVSIERDSLL